MRSPALQFHFHNLLALLLLLLCLLLAFTVAAKPSHANPDTSTTSSQLKNANSERKTASREQPSTSTLALTPIHDPETLKIIRTIQKRTEEIRGIHLNKPLPAYILDSDTLQRLVLKEINKQYPLKRRAAIEQMLKSLAAVPKDFDLQQTILSLLDEQVGGLYDPDSKRLFVREGFDIQTSVLAQLILAHEICHALQDSAYNLKSMGIEDTTNDDRTLAATAVAEGDATTLMADYAVRYAAQDMLKELPAALLMDQSALNAAPHFFHQQLLFPYIQGQAFLEQALARDADWRVRIFTDPPRTTEQLLHPEKYFDRREGPTSLTLQTSGGIAAFLIALPNSANATVAPYETIETNRLGELGIRLIFEDRLGTGIAAEAAAGWNGDAYAITRSPDARHWRFCLETAWDTPADAEEFQGAWITLWRSIANDKKLGDLTAPDQQFRAAPWLLTLHRTGNRILISWRN